MIEINGAHLIKTALLSYHTSIPLLNQMYIILRVQSNFQRRDWAFSLNCVAHLRNE